MDLRSQVSAFRRYIFTLSVFLCLLGCGAANELYSELPDPIGDVTESDRYIIGLKWYESGDYDIARKFWAPLAKQGDCDAQYALGYLYFRGLGVGKSHKKALELWDRSANQGNVQAQTNLGIAYSWQKIRNSALDCTKGCGSDKDLVEAYKWFKIAESGGIQQEQVIARRHLEKIRYLMNIDRVNSGDLVVLEWKPEVVDCGKRAVRVLAH